MDKRSSTPKVVTKKHIARLEREQRQIRLIRGFAIGGLILVVALLILWVSADECVYQSSRL